MGETVRSAPGSPRKNSSPLDGVCIALVSVGVFILIPALMFSLGPLVASGGRAWEYEPVRELFIASVVIFLLLVVLPLVARYGTARNRKWGKASAVAVGVASSLLGALFLISALSSGMAGGFIIPGLFFVSSAGVFWLLYRKRAV